MIDASLSKPHTSELNSGFVIWWICYVYILSRASLSEPHTNELNGDFVWGESERAPNK